MNQNQKIIPFLTLVALALTLTGCLAGRQPGQFAAGIAAPEVASVTRGPLAVTISAIGNVRPAQSAVLIWQTSGKVGQVMVKTGQVVAEGQVLAELDPTSLPNNILQAKIDLINAQNNLDDLYKPDPYALAQAQDALDKARGELDALKNPTPAAIAQAELAIVDAQNAVDDAEYALSSLLNGRGSPRLINEARAKYLLAQDRVEQVQSLYDQTPGDSNEDAVKAQALANLEGAKRDRDRALASLNWYLGKPSEQEMAEAQGKLDLANANLMDAEDTLEKLKNPSEQDISLAQAKVDDAVENLDNLHKGPSEDDITIAQTRLDLAQANVNLTNLTASFPGTITQVKLLPGDLISAGTQAFQIDDLSTMYLDLEVSEIDIQQIQVAQPVDVIFDALPDQRYQAEVSEISQVGTSTQGVINFTVTVKLISPEKSIRPGMTAEASIQVAQVDDILQIPTRFIFDENGKRFVYRQDGETIEQVFIQVGLSSGAASEIISGDLKEGDQVTSQPTGFGFGPGGGGPNGGFRSTRDQP